MTIYIKEIDMPKSCSDCTLAEKHISTISFNIKCKIANLWTIGNNAALKRHDECPLKSIEEYKIKNGNWIETGLSNSTGPIVRCSCCGMYINPSDTAIELKRQKLKPRYCENCGSRMLEQEERSV